LIRLKQANAERFCSGLPAATGLLLLPSTLVDQGETHVRIGFGRRTMPDVLALADAYLNTTITSMQP
jgi:hypothetical protein